MPDIPNILYGDNGMIVHMRITDKPPSEYTCRECKKTFKEMPVGYYLETYKTYMAKTIDGSDFAPGTPVTAEPIRIPGAIQTCPQCQDEHRKAETMIRALQNLFYFYPKWWDYD